MLDGTMVPAVELPGEDRDLGRTAFLARGVQRGDSSLFDELYARTAPSLYAWAVLRSPASVDPGDIIGEVWLRAVAGLRTHDGANYEFRAWIFGIAKNVLLQFLRVRRNDRTVTRTGIGPHGVSTNALDQLPESVTSISRRLAHEDSIRLLHEYADRLDATDRELLVHCGIEGSTCTDVATRIGIATEAATKRWQRLRADLRDKAWIRGLILEVD